MEIKMNTPMKALVGLSLAALMAAPALAGGLNEPVIEPAPAAPVTYVAPSQDWTGGYVGAQLGYADGSVGAASGNNGTYGLRAGYDWDFGKWVVGAGLDWDKTDVDLGGTDKLDSIARLKLRAGADLGKTLIYVTAGGAHAKANIAGVSHSDNGWFAGIGADYAVNDKWTVGAEVVKNQFDNFDNLGVDADATTASVNVGFRF
jgi:outer membrane immunogenic protein